MDNRHGLAVATRLTHASGTAEWEMAPPLVREVPYRRRRVTLGADPDHRCSLSRPLARSIVVLV